MFMSVLSALGLFTGVATAALFLHGAAAGIQAGIRHRELVSTAQHLYNPENGSCAVSWFESGTNVTLYEVQALFLRDVPGFSPGWYLATNLERLWLSADPWHRAAFEVAQREREQHERAQARAKRGCLREMSRVVLRPRQNELLKDTGALWAEQTRLHGGGAA